MTAFVFIAILSIALSSKNLKEVKCKHSSVQWNYFKRSLFSCRIENQKIDDIGFTITRSSNTTVELLDIQNATEVKYLPANIAEKFPHIVAFQVYDCSVESINEVNFKNLLKLRYLHLPRNEIEHIDNNAFRDLIKLEWLSLFHNKIEYIDPRIFRTLQHLKFLHLGENRIEVLSSTTFVPLRQLQVLNLKKNKINFLHHSTFELLGNLKNLSLSNNNFIEIEDLLLKNNSRIEYIWLHANKIKFLKSSIFDHMKNLKYLNLEENVCADKKYFQETFSVEVIKNDLQTNCGSPKEQLESCEANQKDLRVKLEIIERKFLNEVVKSNQLEMKNGLSEKMKSWII